MTAVVCRGGLGTLRARLALPATNDALIGVLLQQNGLQAVDTIRDYASLQALLAASNDEPTATGYARWSSTTPATAAYDATNNRWDLDIADPVFPAVGTLAAAQAAPVANTAAAFLLCYDPDTTTGGDDSIEVLTYHDYARILDGSDVIVQIATAGIGRAQGG